MNKNISVANINIHDNSAHVRYWPHSDQGKKILHTMSLFNSCVETLTYFSALEINQ